MKEIDILQWDALDPSERDRTLRRPAVDTGERAEAVAAIIEQVRASGDAALRQYSERFDGVRIDAIAVDEAQIDSAAERVDPALLTAIDNAIGRIRTFHEACMPEAVWSMAWTTSSLPSSRARAVISRAKGV